MKKSLTIVDMFAGAGGESTGIYQAAQRLGFNINLTAINHWERAVETHAKNHPSAIHLCESVEKLDPFKIVPGQKVDLLWASPECTHHSVARGGRPRSDQSRASAWIILDWISKLQVRRIIIENVPEFTTWGPLDENGIPIKSEKGKTFQAFILSIRSLGYTVDWDILNAANYGDPTIRRRLFIQAVKGGKKIMWPNPTHMENPLNHSGCKQWKSAKEIIDWTIPGQSIFNRNKPLADATMRRIEHGIKRFWGSAAEPFLIILRGTSTSRSINEPLPTVTCSGAHYALIEPFITRFHGGDGSEKRNHSLNEPIPVIDTSNRYGLVEPFLIKYYGTGENVSQINLPLGTITTKDRFALVSGDNRYGLDITLRMLKPNELKRGQGFSSHYQILGNMAEQTKQIGNAVPVGLAEALSEMALSEYKLS